MPNRVTDPAQQWSLYIDIEGFGHTYDAGTQALDSLGALMEGIFQIGTRCLVESPNRIFAHQVGDGFVVVGDFAWDSLEEPITVAIALLRKVLAAGGVAKAAVDEGRFADVIGCYPKVIRDQVALAKGAPFSLGGGLMTIFPVMGTALIKAHRLISSHDAPSGPLLMVAASNAHRLPDGTRFERLREFGVIDWVHTEFPGLRDLIEKGGLPNPDVPSMARTFQRYLALNTLSDTWRGNAQRYLHLDEVI